MPGGGVVSDAVAGLARDSIPASAAVYDTCLQGADLDSGKGGRIFAHVDVLGEQKLSL